VHVVTSDLGEAMLNDLLAGRSRTTLFGTGNEPLRMEPEHQQAGGNAQGNNSQKDADAYAPANQPEIEPEAPPLKAP
jgi:hypothetical protein